MQTRTVLAQDAENLQKYLSNIIGERIPTLYLREKGPELNELEGYISDYISSENALCLIVEHDDHIIGCLNFNSSDRPQCSHSGEFTVTVAKEWRNKGVGTTLVKALISWVKQHKNIFRIEVEVFSNNPEALKIYEKLNFVHEGVKNKAVLIGENYIDVILMAWMEK